MQKSEQQGLLEPCLGPMTEKEVPSTEITFSDNANVPKLRSIDERRLSEQISRLKSKDTKSANQDLSQTEKHNIYLKNNGWQKNSLKQQVDSQPERIETAFKATSSEKTEIRNYPVKASNSEIKQSEIKPNPSQIIYKSNLNGARKRTFNEVSDTDDKIRSLKGDLREPAIPHRKLQHKNTKDPKTEEANIEANIKKARKRRDKERRKQRKEQSYSSEDSKSSNSESSDNTVTSQERDELIRKYFKKILCPIFQEERELSK
jgi:hypothetical protein